VVLGGTVRGLPNSRGYCAIWISGNDPPSPKSSNVRGSHPLRWPYAGAPATLIAREVSGGGGEGGFESEYLGVGRRDERVFIAAIVGKLMAEMKMRGLD
jgi:hypothetical protein